MQPNSERNKDFSYNQEGRELYRIFRMGGGGPKHFDNRFPKHFDIRMGLALVYNDLKKQEKYIKVENYTLI